MTPCDDRIYFLMVAAVYLLTGASLTCHAKAVQRYWAAEALRFIGGVSAGAGLLFVGILVLNL